MDGELKREKNSGRSLEAERPPKQRQFPWLIISLVILNWFIFLYSLYRNNCPSQTGRRDKCLLQGALGRFSFQPFKENTQFGPAMSTLVNLGGFKWDFRKDQRKKWRILSSILFHRGLVSLAFDTISLLYTGMKLEQNFGIAKIGLLYFLSSIGGSIWASLRIEGVVYVGGPSGVCGLTGGAFAEFFINWHMHKEKLKRFQSLCLGVAFNFASRLFLWTDVTGNIGGIYMGFLVGFLLLIQRQPGSMCKKYKHSGFDSEPPVSDYSQYQRVLWVIALISTIIQFLYSLIVYILN